MVEVKILPLGKRNVVNYRGLAMIKKKSSAFAHIIYIIVNQQKKKKKKTVQSRKYEQYMNIIIYKTNKNGS